MNKNNNYSEEDKELSFKITDIEQAFVELNRESERGLIHDLPRWAE